METRDVLLIAGVVVVVAIFMGASLTGGAFWERQNVDLQPAYQDVLNILGNAEVIEEEVSGDAKTCNEICSGIDKTCIHTEMQSSVNGQWIYHPISCYISVPAGITLHCWCTSPEDLTPQPYDTNFPCEGMEAGECMNYGDDCGPCKKAGSQCRYGKCVNRSEGPPTCLAGAGKLCGPSPWDQ